MVPAIRMFDNGSSNVAVIRQDGPTRLRSAGIKSGTETFTSYGGSNFNLIILQAHCNPDSM